MANSDRLFGLKPVDNLRQPGTLGRIRRYLINSDVDVPVGIGDPVKSAGSADASTGLPTVTRAAAGDALRGVVVGFDQVDGVAIASTNLNRIHRPASVAMYAMVCDDPDTLFEIQEDDSATFAVTMVGENADLATVGDCNTTTGISTVELSTTSHTTDAAQLRIIGVPRLGIDNAVSAHAKLTVLINEHELKATAGV